MKGKMNIYYDEEADYLEIFIGESRPNYGEEASDNITIFRDEKTNEVIGLGILNFKKRAKNLQGIKLDLPIDIGIFLKEA
ncbi:MAG: DUF2283 domain-containing protein [Candidatus Nanoarchaeia archaeon]|nr:DUF2283 domain-containing protein [Candidatus Nanoarchaeia archaeon]MDD5741082.1 DUF2283 domain-containing protein [Candidatus Nanoarchaeia archaeon]